MSFFVTSFAEQFTVFLIGMIILTFGEMFVWPAVPTIANYLAPQGKQGQYQGVVNSAINCRESIWSSNRGYIGRYIQYECNVHRNDRSFINGMFSYLF